MKTQDENSSNANSDTKLNSRRRWLGYSLAGLVGMLGVTSLSAIAMGGPDGWCNRGNERMHWSGRHGGEGFAPGMRQEFAERRIDKILYQIDATPEQRKQVKEIFGKVFQERGDHRLDRQQHRQAIVELLSQPEIDRAKLEALRTEQLQQMEQMSGRMTQALADAAEVLTAEQRAKLGELVAQRGFGPKRHLW